MLFDEVSLNESMMADLFSDHVYIRDVLDWVCIYIGFHEMFCYTKN